MVSPPPTLLTQSLPKLEADFKRAPEDFRVEEIPLYAPCGEGTHLYLHIEKRGITTHEAVREIARALGKAPRDIGYAGLKDAQAVTRQTLSVEHVDPAAVKGIESDRIRILGVARHRNKIKRGHLKGNRFVITLRERTEGGFDRPEALAGLQSVLSVLQRRGVPNYFGVQRFGLRGDNAAIGRAALKGDAVEALTIMLGRPTADEDGAVREARERFDAGQWSEAEERWPHAFRHERRTCRVLAESDGDFDRAWRQVDRSLRVLYLNAIQSELFNKVLATRIEALDQILEGDLAWKHNSGACFHVVDSEAEQLRCEAFEISASGPMFGRKMSDPQGVPFTIESQVLAEWGLVREVLTRGDGRLIDGARRPLRVPLTEFSIKREPEGLGSALVLEFVLPPGSYATSVIREICGD